MNNLAQFRSEGISRKPTRIAAGAPPWVRRAQERNLPNSDRTGAITCYPHKPSQPCVQREEG